MRNIQRSYYSRDNRQQSGVLRRCENSSWGQRNWWEPYHDTRENSARETEPCSRNNVRNNNRTPQADSQVNIHTPSITREVRALKRSEFVGTVK